jgi:hypothetical protein
MLCWCCIYLYCTDWHITSCIVKWRESMYFFIQLVSSSFVPPIRMTSMHSTRYIRSVYNSWWLPAARQNRHIPFIMQYQQYTVITAAAATATPEGISKHSLGKPTWLAALLIGRHLLPDEAMPLILSAPIILYILKYIYIYTI